MRKETEIIFVDVHAETTSEKIAMGRFLDGKVSAVIGTHTHVQTADDRILPGGTAFLCDAGMCGPSESILGRDIESIVARFLTNLPVQFPIARGPVRMQGALMEIDEGSGRATAMERFNQEFVPRGQASAGPTRTATAQLPTTPDASREPGVGPEKAP